MILRARQVVHRPGFDRSDSDRQPVRAHHRLDVAAEVAALAGVPHIDDIHLLGTPRFFHHRPIWTICPCRSKRPSTLGEITSVCVLIHRSLQGDECVEPCRQWPRRPFGFQRPGQMNYRERAVRRSEHHVVTAFTLRHCAQDDTVRWMARRDLLLCFPFERESMLRLKSNPRLAEVTRTHSDRVSGPTLPGSRVAFGPANTSCTRHADIMSLATRRNCAAHLLAVTRHGRLPTGRGWPR